VLDIYAALWRKFRTIETAPSDFTDVKFVNTYADALAYLIRKGNKMGRSRIPLSIFYDKGSSYHFAKHVLLTLPHQTNNVSVECVVESVSKNKNAGPGGKVSLKFAILDELPDYWQDTVDAVNVKINTVDSETVIQDITG
jgi:hypothetical protein